MSDVFVKFQPTPNPNAGKFVLDASTILGAGRRSVTTAEEARGDPAAERLMAIPGVARLFFVENFITVTKEPSTQWEDLIPEVAQAIREAYG